MSDRKQSSSYLYCIKEIHIHTAQSWYGIPVINGQPNCFSFVALPSSKCLPRIQHSCLSSSHHVCIPVCGKDEGAKVNAFLREGSQKLSRKGKGTYLPLYPVGQKLVTWPLITRGWKCSLNPDSHMPSENQRCSYSGVTEGYNRHWGTASSLCHRYQ